MKPQIVDSDSICDIIATVSVKHQLFMSQLFEIEKVFFFFRLVANTKTKFNIFAHYEIIVSFLFTDKDEFDVSSKKIFLFSHAVLSTEE